jgi:hypothetical protein
MKQWWCVSVMMLGAACATGAQQPRMPIMGAARIYSGAVDDQACLGALGPRYQHPEFDERLLAPPPDGETARMPPDRKRIVGNLTIPPNSSVQASLGNPAKISASIKICVGADGVPAAVTLLRSSCVAAYDLQLLDEVRRWRYASVAPAESPLPQCTAVTFIYSQR